MTNGTAKVEIGQWLSAGWKMYASHWQTWTKMGVVSVGPVILPLIGCYVGYFGIFASLMPSFTPGPYGPVYQAPSGPPMWAIGVMALSGLLLFVASFWSMYCQIGMWKAALKTARGGTPEMSDLWGNGSLFGKVFVAQFVVWLLTMVGFMLCCIPGFIVLGWYHYVMVLTVDKNLSLGDAMATSKNTTAGQLPMYILWSFVVGLCVSVGSYACCVGIVATMGLQFTMGAAAYRAAFEGVNWGPQPVGYPPPAAPPPAAY